MADDTTTTAAAAANDGDPQEQQPTGATAAGAEQTTETAEATATDGLVIPGTDEELAAVTDDDLAALTESAQTEFSATYGDGTNLTEDALDRLAALTEGIETLAGETTRRREAAAAREAQAAELAARVSASTGTSDDGTDSDGAGDTDPSGEDDSAGDGDQPPADPPADPGDGAAVPDTPGDAAAAADTTRRAPVTASAPRRAPLRVSRASSGGSTFANRHVPAAASSSGPVITDVLRANGDHNGYASDTGLDWDDVGVMINNRLMSTSTAPYEQAALRGQPLKRSFSEFAVHKPTDERLTLRSEGDLDEVYRVFDYATSESRLKDGSLVASGGWCAPSETFYDLLPPTESRDGLLSIPEVTVKRGGFRFTKGPDFRTLFSQAGFSYTEQEDIDGDYDGNGGGEKPCWKIDCPEFEEVRLGLEGLCITAGLLMSKGYPEVVASTVRRALVAHDHHLDAKILGQMAQGSTRVDMPSPQRGALAPMLTAIEAQVEHYRYQNRAARRTTMEVVLPYWIHGAIRADLSRRTGVDLFNVTDAQIDSWFASRGIRTQFVYNWQDIGAGDAADFVAFPETVQFLMYPAGTWVKGKQDVLTLETLYDSALLAHNDFVALWTEEGVLVAKRGHDSRLVSVPICADGATAAGVDFDCDGTVSTGGATVTSTTSTTRPPATSTTTTTQA